MATLTATTQPPSETRPLGWAALVPALVVPLLGSLIYFVFVPEGAVGQMAYTATKIFTLAYPLLFLRLTGTRGLLSRGPGRWPSLRTTATRGLGIGVAIAAFGGALMLTPLGEMVRAGAAAVQTRSDGLGFGEHFVLYALFVCIVHSAIEEYYWRWFVFGQLRKITNRWLAHAIAGVAFAAHHLVVTLQFFPVGLAVLLAVAVAVGGFLWSVMYERDGTLVGTWLSHLCVDALLMVVGYQLVMG